MYRFWKQLKNESAGVMVENAVVLPIVFVVIISMIVSAFLVFDRVTVETAARHGATYASQCIADPSYSSLMQQTSQENFLESVKNMNFSSVGKKIKAYRYLSGGVQVQDVVETEVVGYINRFRINWLPQENISVVCLVENKIIYQDVCVQVASSYYLPGWLEWFGLETEYRIETEARIAAVDPDEFIRNADLVVDLITRVDNASGGHISNAIDKIGGLAAKLMDWISME